MSQLRHRPLFNLLSQIIRSVGQPLPDYYMQRPDGTMLNVMDNGNGCAAYVSRLLAALGEINGSRLIDGPHGMVSSTVTALRAAGWQEVSPAEQPKPGDVIVWESQQQVDGVHAHIGFSLGNGEPVSTNYLKLVVSRHGEDRNAHDEPRKIERLLRYPWPAEEYDALAHLNTADGSAA